MTHLACLQVIYVSHIKKPKRIATCDQPVVNYGIVRNGMDKIVNWFVNHFSFDEKQ
jgi:hypothetical protein